MNAWRHGFTARYFPCLLEKGSVEWQECIDLGIRLHEQHSNVLRSGCYPQVVDKMVRYHSGHKPTNSPSHSTVGTLANKA